MSVRLSGNGTPQRIQLSRKKGWRMPPNTLKVDRTTLWGNPFIVGKHGTRAECVDLFKKLMAGFVCLNTGNGFQQQDYRAHVHRNRKALRGKNLACWCPVGQPCHADILLQIAKAS